MVSRPSPSPWARPLQAWLQGQRPPFPLLSRRGRPFPMAELKLPGPDAAPLCCRSSVLLAPPPSERLQQGAFLPYALELLGPTSARSMSMATQQLHSSMAMAPPPSSSLPRRGNAGTRALSLVWVEQRLPLLSPPRRPLEMAPNSPGTFLCFVSLPPLRTCQVFDKMSRETCCCSTVGAHRLVAVFAQPQHHRRSPPVRPRRSLFDSASALFPYD
jgi:hypothetical protein